MWINDPKTMSIVPRGMFEVCEDIPKASSLKTKFFLVGPTLRPDLAHACALILMVKCSFLLAIYVYPYWINLNSPIRQ